MTFASCSGRRLAPDVAPVGPCHRGNQQTREVIR